jgi:hypothetical protein
MNYLSSHGQILGKIENTFRDQRSSLFSRSIKSEEEEKVLSYWQQTALAAFTSWKKYYGPARTILFQEWKTKESKT